MIYKIELNYKVLVSKAKILTQEIKLLAAFNPIYNFKI